MNGLEIVIRGVIRLRMISAVEGPFRLFEAAQFLFHFSANPALPL